MDRYFSKPNSLALGITVSLCLHLVFFSWCPFPSFTSPPHPNYLVVDLFSGPATSGTGQGFDDESADGGKTKDSPTALPAYPKHRLEKHRSPQPTTPGPSTKVAKKKPVSHETAPLKSAAKRTSESEESMNTKKSIQDETANPFTDRQHNPESTPETSDARGNGSGQDTLSGSGTGPGRGSGSGLGRGGRSGSGSPVETPFAYGTNPPPPYPSTARRRGWEGEVLLLVDVTAQGEVCNVTVSRSSGYRILDRAALNAIYRWKFQAAQRNGRAVAGKVMVPIRFSIQDAK
jgi:protein TonB